jgi:amylosucrase
VQRAPFPDGAIAAGSPAARIHDGLRRLIALRRSLTDLAAGMACTLLPTADPALLALARGERFLGLFNFADREVAADTCVLRPWECIWLDRATGERLN